MDKHYLFDWCLSDAELFGPRLVRLELKMLSFKLLSSLLLQSVLIR